MKKILVLGGTGWVGHHIVLDFQAHGYDVTVGSRGQKLENYAVQPNGVRRVAVDKSSETDMQQLLSEGFDVVIDSVPTLKSLELVHKYAAKLKHYLHCSSTGGYAPLPFVPCNETAPYRGYRGGWVDKANVDTEAMRLFNSCGFPATVIRPCYITGGGDRFPLDNLGGRREDFLTDIINGKPLEVANDGLALLQPIHVADLAASFRNAVENRRSIGERYNICLDHSLQFNDYLKLNGEALDKEVILEHVPLAELQKRYPEKSPVGMAFAAEHMCFSIEKARTEIGYAPCHTPEDTIVETARLCAAKLG